MAPNGVLYASRVQERGKQFKMRSPGCARDRCSKSHKNCKCSDDEVHHPRLCCTPMAASPFEYCPVKHLCLVINIRTSFVCLLLFNLWAAAQHHHHHILQRLNTLAAIWLENLFLLLLRSCLFMAK